MTGPLPTDKDIPVAVSGEPSVTAQAKRFPPEGLNVLEFPVVVRPWLLGEAQRALEVAGAVGAGVEPQPIKLRLTPKVIRVANKNNCFFTRTPP